MRVAVVNSFYSPDIVGGAELAVQGLAEGLAASGVAIQVFSLGQTSELASSAGIDNRRIEPTNGYWSVLPWKDVATPLRALGHLRQMYTRKPARDVCMAISSFRPDIVHLHNVSGFSAALYDELPKQCPDAVIVQTLHDYWLACIRNTLLDSRSRLCNDRPMPCRIRSNWLSTKTHCVTRFVSPSSFLADYLADIGLISRDRFSVIPNGIKPSTIPYDEIQAHRSDSISKTDIGVLYLGQLIRSKGLSTLLEAAKALRDTKLSIKIAGSGPLENQVSQSPYVTYVGSVQGQEKERALLDADILVVPSEWYENNPLAILEGLQYGLAIVGTRIGGIPELVHDGENGRLVDSSSAGDLAAALIDVCENRERLYQYQTRSLEMSKNFTIGTFVDSHMQLFEELTGRAGPI